MVPPLDFFSALCDFFERIFFSNISSFFFQKIVLRFLSLRYGADFRRSRLVHIIVYTFFILQRNVCIQKSKLFRIRPEFRIESIEKVSVSSLNLRLPHVITNLDCIK